MQEQIYQDNIFEDNRKDYLSINEVDKYFISLEELKKDYIHKQDVSPSFSFEITGRTKKGAFVCISLGSLDFVKEYFISKYPRFQGKATIYQIEAKEVVKGLFQTDKRVSYKEFTNINELKEIS